MIVQFGATGMRPEWPGAVTVLGTFDGVHLGHAEVIRTAVAQAEESKRPCAIVTFDRHPATVLAPDRVPPQIATLQQNLRAFRELGVGVALVVPFDNTMRETTALGFTDTVLRQALKTQAIVVGHDFAMGRGREGTPDWLRQHFPVTVVPPFEHLGRRVSSTEIRGFVAEGDVASAAQLLGRPFALSGVVVTGEQVGRGLGYPTANLARPNDQVLPADGVYAAWARLRGKRHMAAVSIGMRPTVGGQHRTIEAYLCDYDGPEFYGLPLELDFVDRRRGEEHFADLDALKEEIAADVTWVRQRLLGRD